MVVAGATSVQPDGSIYGAGEACAGAMRCFEVIEQALAEAGAELRHVVRRRMFVTAISRWEEFGRAHGAFFRDIRPGATMVKVSRLIDPDIIIEVEVDAVIDWITELQPNVTGKLPITPVWRSFDG